MACLLALVSLQSALAGRPPSHGIVRARRGNPDGQAGASRAAAVISLFAVVLDGSPSNRQAMYQMQGGCRKTRASLLPATLEYRVWTSLSTCAPRAKAWAATWRTPAGYR